MRPVRQFLVKARGRTAHEFDVLDPAIPMRSTCRGYRAWPQELIPAASCRHHPDRPYGMDDPAYCPKCLAA